MVLLLRAAMENWKNVNRIEDKFNAYLHYETGTQYVIALQALFLVEHSISSFFACMKSKSFCGYKKTQLNLFNSRKRILELLLGGGIVCNRAKVAAWSSLSINSGSLSETINCSHTLYLDTASEDSSGAASSLVDTPASSHPVRAVTPILTVEIGPSESSTLRSRTAKSTSKPSVQYCEFYAHRNLNQCLKKMHVAFFLNETTCREVHFSRNQV